MLFGWPTVRWVDPDSDDVTASEVDSAPTGKRAPLRTRREGTGDIPVLLDAGDDRWEWRRRIRQHPTQSFVYRIGVGLLGTLLIVAGLATGPIPGPGGIPLVLLGLAVWASEFEWAQRLMLVFKAQVGRYRGWPWRTQVVFWVIVLATFWLLGYASLVLFDIPSWVPGSVAGWLDQLPGVHAR